MSLIAGLIVFLTVLVLSILMTGKILDLVVAKNILDHPSSRSLHDMPVPRGGGISIVLLVLIGLVIMWTLNYISSAEFSAFMIGGLLIFITGLVDDIKSISAIVKGTSYFIAAVWGVICLSVDFATTNLVDFIFAFILSACILWTINLYNFMDGSDGFAGMQTLLAAVALIFMAFISGAEFIYYLMLVVAASTCGFLFFNLPPARIFMGDSGSCFMGYVFGLAGYYCYISNIIVIEVWLILFSVFICDSSLTLIMRIVSGKKWYEAHKEHAYQKFILMKQNHKDLLLWFIGLFLVFLLPVLMLTMTIQAYAWYFVIFCYGVLAIIWTAIQFRYKAYVLKNING